MKPFRKNVAIAIDGGGIRGVIVTRALTLLEKQLGQPVNRIFRLAAGTSTGAIISAGIGAGLTAGQMHELYVTLGDVIFRKTLRSQLWLLFKYRYPLGPVEAALKEHLGDKKLGDFWSTTPPTDVVFTAYDLVDSRTRFIKPWKPEYADWPVTTAVLASASVPTFFPPVAGRYVDGGVGAYANPCYITAFEAINCLGWDPAETTLLSFGTGHFPIGLKPDQATGFWAWEWLNPIFGAFLQSAYDEQVQVVGTLFPGLDFRRFQVTLREDIGMDSADQMARMIEYGDELGQKMLNDETESIPDFRRIRQPD